MKTLTHKQRVLLKTVEGLSERATRFMLMKTLFLLAVEEHIGRLIKFYNFFPYRYGPFSNMVYADLYRLERRGFLTFDGTRLALTEEGVRAARSADPKASLKVQRVAGRFDSDREIREYVYNRYPEYTVKSEIAPNITNQTTHPGVFTIGYQGRDIDSFLNILIKNQIDLLIDVRANPFSKNFSFTKNGIVLK